MKNQLIKEASCTSAQQTCEFSIGHDSLPSLAIRPRRTLTQQAQRDDFIKAATLARNWINNIIWNAERDNWSEAEFYLENGRYNYDKMKSLLPTDRAEPQGD